MENICTSIHSRSYQEMLLFHFELPLKDTKVLVHSYITLIVLTPMYKIFVAEFSLTSRFFSNLTFSIRLSHW